MKKNLFEAGVNNDIIERSQKLTVNSNPLWGGMTVVEMLRHCSEAIHSTLTTYPVSSPTTFKQRLNKFFVLNLISKLPKGAKAPKHIDMSFKPFTLETFETEHNNFIQAIRKFQSHQKSLTNKHPYFGVMSNKEWGILTWMHMDHHLRQFGV